MLACMHIHASILHNMQDALLVIDQGRGDNRNFSIVAGFFGMLGLWLVGCTLTASSLYIRTLMHSGHHMSYRARSGLAEHFQRTGVAPPTFDQQMAHREPFFIAEEANVCSILHLLAACTYYNKRAVTTATRSLFAQVWIVRTCMHIAGK